MLLPVARCRFNVTLGGMGDAVLAGVLLATLGGLYLRPFGARDWQVAATGGMGAWLLSPLGLRDGVATIADSWNILAFFLGLMLIAAAADASGLYARAAVILRGGRLGMVPAVLLIGTGITAILSNDATPLILTPAIFAAARMSRADPMPAALAATFTADGASLLLPVSNPVNLLFYDRLDMGFGRYAAEILPAAVVGMLVLGAIVIWRARSIRPSPMINTDVDPSPGWTAYGRFTLAAVCLLAPAYVVAALLSWPLGIVTVSAGAGLSVAGMALGASGVAHVRGHVSPGLFVFVIGMLLLVEALTSAGLFNGVSDALGWLAEQPGIVAIIGAAVVGALLSNLLNNWPAALLLSAAIALTPGQPHELTAGALIGCTIGANLTMLGSLSTVFWTTLGRPRGLGMSSGHYARVAALPTLAAVGAACVAAWVAIGVR